MMLLVPQSPIAQAPNPPYTFDTQYQDPSKINTAGWEDSPYLTPDGKTLYFMYTPTNFWDWHLCSAAGKPQAECVRRLVVRGPQRPNHVGHPNPWRDGNMYAAQRTPQGGWSIPRQVMVGCCMMPTQDGQRIYFSTEDRHSKGKTDIAYVEQSGGAWSQPVLLEALNTPHVEANPHMTADERTLYFTSDRPGGFGGRDLYVAQRTTDGWTKPVNLGAAFNTKHNEDQIWVSVDGQRAYFNRGGGFFLAQRRQQGWSKGRYVSPLFGLTTTDYAGELSFNAVETLAVFALSTPERHDLVIVYCAKDAAGKWSRPQSVDAMSW